MKEPTYDDHMGVEGTPYSQLSDADLREIVSGYCNFYPGEDVDFQKRYAAMLLRARAI